MGRVTKSWGRVNVKFNLREILMQPGIEELKIRFKLW